jgi:hypothetical protein
MAEDSQAPEFLERATKAVIRATTVPLNEFVLKPELYCHRDPEELSDIDRLKPLMDSLIIEGLEHPPEFFRDPDGKPVVDQGHRRISAMRELARQNTPGFSETMPVEAIEVVNATPQDLLCRSVAENINRKTYNLFERIRAAKTLHDGGVEHCRAAHALDYSTKQYNRDLWIAQEEWMFAHVENDDINHTQASELVEAADKAGRMADLKQHLDLWIEERKKEIRQKASREGKSQPTNEKVKGQLTKQLSDHWIAQLKNNLPLDDTLVQAPEVPIAGIDTDANKVVFSETEIDLLKIPVPDLAKAIAELTTTQKVMMSYLVRRYAVEGPAGAQSLARQESEQIDVSALRSAGLNDLANALSGPQGPESPKGENPTEAKEGNP